MDLPAHDRMAAASSGPVASPADLLRQRLSVRHATLRRPAPTVHAAVAGVAEIVERDGRPTVTLLVLPFRLRKLRFSAHQFPILYGKMLESGRQEIGSG